MISFSEMYATEFFCTLECKIAKTIVFLYISGYNTIEKSVIMMHIF